MKQHEEQKLSPLEEEAINRKLVEAEIIALAWADEAFRAKLEADPAAALSEAGILLPEGKTICVLREEPGSVQIVLPSKPPIAAEANDAELAAAAGGGLLNDGKCELYDKISGKHDIQNDLYGRPQLTNTEVGISRVLLGGVAGVFALGGLSWGWG